MVANLKLEIASILSRCFVHNIYSNLLKWDHLDASELANFQFRNTRVGYCRTLLEQIQNKTDLSEDAVGELDLICFQGSTKKKKWSIFHLEDKKGNSRTNTSLSNVKTFKKKLKNQLSLYFNGDMKLASKVFDGAIWTRLYLPLSKKSSRFATSDVIYLVHYPHTDYFAVSNFKESVRKYLFQSLLTTFGYSSVKNLLLTGNHLHSLFQLALNKKGQGSFSRNQLQQIQKVPQSLLRPRKRKVCDLDIDPDIYCQDEGTKKQKLEILESQFGPHEQPIIEKLEFKLETRMRGSDKPVAMEQYDKESFHCHVKFEGHGVLEGIRNLAECGLADLPLPKHLSTVHTLAKNHFVLKDSTSGKSSSDKSLNKTKDKVLHIT